MVDRVIDRVIDVQWVERGKGARTEYGEKGFDK